MARKLTKILIVDDDEDTVTITKYCLETSLPGVTVETASCGREGIEMAKDFRPDLILLDVMMPVMDGIETMKEIRKIATLKDVGIILFTAKVQGEEVAGYSALNALGVIAKPFDPFKINDQILSMWDMHNNTFLLSVKAEYQKSIPEKLKLLEEHVNLVKKEKSLNTLKELRFCVHKMAGSAGTYGFSVVSEEGKHYLPLLDSLISNFHPDKIEDALFNELMDAFVRGFQNGS